MKFEKLLLWKIGRILHTYTHFYYQIGYILWLAPLHKNNILINESYIHHRITYSSSISGLVFCKKSDLIMVQKWKKQHDKGKILKIFLAWMLRNSPESSIFFLHDRFHLDWRISTHPLALMINLNQFFLIKFNYLYYLDGLVFNYLTYQFTYILAFGGPVPKFMSILGFRITKIIPILILGSRILVLGLAFHQNLLFLILHRYFRSFI